MAKRSDIKKILLIGSGPITIGQASEFDYSGTQAIRALKEEGIEVVLINSNPATIMTDPGFADRIYIEPLTIDFLEKVIETERPHACIPTMGGQTALNLAVKAAESGLFDRYNIELLGANLRSIHLAEDRKLFKQTMESLGIHVAKSHLVTTIDEGLNALNTIGLPLILRPSFTLGGEGGGVVYTKEDYLKLLERGLFLSPTSSVLVEESLIGWKEYELEVVRDRNDNVIIVCSIENLDPMGVHTGDSITVAPAQTLTDKQFQLMRDQAKDIIRAINVDTGGSNIQFAIKPFGADAGRMVVIEMNPRVSRSSALASKATGFPIARIATKLAIGYTLDELTNDITGTTPASFEPTIDYVVVKIPRFDFEKFSTSPPLLGTQMKSVGEAMGIGMTFKEAFLKALVSMEQSKLWLMPTPELDKQALLTQLSKPTWDRFFYVATAIRIGLNNDEITSACHFDPWFLDEFREIIEGFDFFTQHTPPESWTATQWLNIKRLGISDRELADRFKKTITDIQRLRSALRIEPGFGLVDTCSAEFDAKTPYLYSSYHTNYRHEPLAEESIIILGSGPNRIGQGIEFDYCCVHASQAAQELGIKSIMFNCNPETVSTDYDVSSRLYFEPLTVEHIQNVFQHEKKCRGVLVQLGGQTPLKLSKALAAQNIPIIGTSVASTDQAEDRKLFETLINSLAAEGLKQPKSKTVTSKSDAIAAASDIGYPVMIRPSYVLGGRGMRIVFSEQSLAAHFDAALAASDNHPVLIDQYLVNAKEVDVDCIVDDEQVLIGGLLEHIEEAGVHSGDSACSLPPFTLSPEIIQRLKHQTRILGRALDVRGLLNIQFAIFNNDDIYVLEANPRASRTVPFTAKAVGHPLVKIATKVALGQSLRAQGYTEDFDLNVDLYNVKMPVFPFHKFPNVDVVLGPEMRSTGEVMGRAQDFASAFAKSWIGAGSTLPRNGTAFLSIGNRDKPKIGEIALRLRKLGFALEATKGTAHYLNNLGIECQTVAKLQEHEVNCVTAIKENRYQIVINTQDDENAMLDGYAIRRTALEKKIPYSTRLTTARALVQAIEASQNNPFPLFPL